MNDLFQAATDSSDGLSRRASWAEATVSLIENDPRIYAYAPICDYVFADPRIEAHPYEPLADYFAQPDTHELVRIEIIQGCLYYLEKLKIKIASGEPFSFDRNDKHGYSNTEARLSYESLTGRMVKAAPDLVSSHMSSASRELLDYCLTLGKVDYDVICGVAGNAGMLDRRPWGEQADYWLGLLGAPVILGHVFRHVMKYDPANPALDQAIVDMFCKQLRGEERIFASFLLKDLAKVRSDDALIPRILSEVPDELQPALVKELADKGWSKDWVKLVPERAPINRSIPYKGCEA